jgi:hypothetical protein
MVIAHAERVAARSLCLKLQLGWLRYSHLVVGEGGSSSVSHTRCIAAILVHVELLLHVVVGPGVVCGKEVCSDLVSQVRVGVGRGPVETLVASVALSLVSMGVVGVQLGVGRVASGIRHANLARLLLWGLEAVTSDCGFCVRKARFVQVGSDDTCGCSRPGSWRRRTGIQ